MTKEQAMEWARLAAAFFAGGLGGAIFKACWDKWSSRQQPIGYDLAIDPIFSGLPHKNVLQAKVEITHNGRKTRFDDLSLIRLTVVNNSNKDMTDFVFGVSISGDHGIVMAYTEGRDHHHVCNDMTATATPVTPCDRSDFECRPFNRGDEYVVKLYVKNAGPLLAEHVRISSPAPIRFVLREKDIRVKSAAQVLGDVLKGVPGGALGAALLGSITGKSKPKGPPMS